MFPTTETELLNRANNIAGMTVKELAQELHIPVPSTLKYAKGFIGELVEIALGATAGSKPMQDFPHLNIELKTIPINYDAIPVETTHVCILHEDKLCGLDFYKSNFYNKIKRVLWVPVEGEKSIPLPERRIGQAFLWELDKDNELLLKNDFEEILEHIALYSLQNTKANIGTYMQVRPSGIINGKKIYGYYLKRNFTTQIMHNYFN